MVGHNGAADMPLLDISHTQAELAERGVRASADAEQVLQLSLQLR